MQIKCNPWPSTGSKDDRSMLTFVRHMTGYKHSWRCTCVQSTKETNYPSWRTRFSSVFTHGKKKNLRTMMFWHIDCVSSSVDKALTTQHKCSKDLKGVYIYIYIYIYERSSAAECLWIYKYLRPASWSSGQSLWLLIMRSRVRFPALPCRIFLEGEDSRGDHGLGRLGLRPLLALHPPLSQLTHHRDNVTAPNRRPNLRSRLHSCHAQEGGPQSPQRTCGGIGGKKKMFLDWLAFLYSRFSLPQMQNALWFLFFQCDWEFW